MKILKWAGVIALIWLLADFASPYLQLTNKGERVPDLKIVVIDEPLVFHNTSTPLAAYKASQNMLCDMPVLSITRAAGSFASNFSVGTTTATGTSFVTTSTVTLVTSTYIGTTTVGYAGPGFGVGLPIMGQGTWYAGGNTTTFPFPLKLNEYVLVYSDFKNATSTTSTQPIGGYTLQGKLKIKCLTNS